MACKRSAVRSRLAPPSFACEATEDAKFIDGFEPLRPRQWNTDCAQILTTLRPVACKEAR